MIVRRFEETISPWLVVCFTLALFLGSWSDNCKGKNLSLFVAARPRNSIQLAIGEWDVSIRGSFWMDPSRIFPSMDNHNGSDDVVFPFARTRGKTKENRIDEKTIIPFVKRRPWGTSLDCVLSLASDGTFVLTPKYCVEIKDLDDKDSPSDEKEDYGTTSHDALSEIETSNETARNGGLLDLRGSWNVLANPYCVTDRLYDQVSLKSYPRQKVAKRNQETATSVRVAEGDVLRTSQLILNCQMWGRHNRPSPGRRGTRQHQQERYRMTHGTLVCKDCDAPWWKQFCRPVVGSFSAVRSSSKPKHEGWIDQERFGY